MECAIGARKPLPSKLYVALQNGNPAQHTAASCTSALPNVITSRALVCIFFMDFSAYLRSTQHQQLTAVHLPTQTSVVAYIVGSKVWVG